MDTINEVKKIVTHLNKEKNKVVDELYELTLKGNIKWRIGSGSLPSDEFYCILHDDTNNEVLLKIIKESEVNYYIMYEKKDGSVIPVHYYAPLVLEPIKDLFSIIINQVSLEGVRIINQILDERIQEKTVKTTKK